MRPLSILLVLLSAVGHVAWNYQVKRSPRPAVYTCWLNIAGAALFLPVALWLSWPPRVPLLGWACVMGTGLLYGAYYTLMARSYDSDDLSRAYPVARGVAPLGTAVLGLCFFHETPSGAGWLGIAGIVLGIFCLCRPAKGAAGPLPLAGIVAAVGTGLCTSGYAAVDKAGVRQVNPALYIVLTFAVGGAAQLALLVPAGGWLPFREEARRAGGSLAWTALLALGSYLLVLYVLKTAPVSYVVPLRSVSVLLGVLAGSHLLKEKGGAGRLAGAALIAGGIAAITLGG